MTKKNIGRVKRWAWTLNNPTEEERDTISGWDCKYICYGNEIAPETGTPHLQGYVEWKSGRKLENLKKLNPRIHWEPAKGSGWENRIYCQKQDSAMFERGVIPMAGRRQIDSLKILKRDSIHGQTIINAKRMRLGIELEREMYREIMENELKKPEVTYIYGDTGTGKTYFAIKEAVNTYGVENVSMIRFVNNFATCNNPQARALIWPEFRPSCLDAATFLEFTDGYGMILNIKHSQVFVRPEAIYICSIKHPSEIYKDEINNQFKRRITRFVNMNDHPYDPDESQSS